MHICVGQRTTYRCSFSPSMCVLRMELRMPGKCLNLLSYLTLSSFPFLIFHLLKKIKLCIYLISKLLEQMKGSLLETQTCRISKTQGTAR